MLLTDLGRLIRAGHLEDKRMPSLLLLEQCTSVHAPIREPSGACQYCDRYLCVNPKLMVVEVVDVREKRKKRSLNI